MKTRRWAVGVLLAVLMAAVVYSILLLHDDKAVKNYWLFGGTGLLTVIVYMTTLLDFRITGGTVGIERARNEVYAVRAEVVEIANTLVKISAMVTDGSGRWGGFPAEHQAKIDEYIQSLRAFLSKDIDLQVAQDIAKVNMDIKKRVDQPAPEANEI